MKIAADPEELYNTLLKRNTFNQMTIRTFKKTIKRFNISPQPLHTFIPIRMTYQCLKPINMKCSTQPLRHNDVNNISLQDIKSNSIGARKVEQKLHIKELKQNRPSCGPKWPSIESKIPLHLNNLIFEKKSVNKQRLRGKKKRLLTNLPSMHFEKVFDKLLPEVKLTKNDEESTHKIFLF